jgi:nitronate monooxygenase
MLQNELTDLLGLSVPILQAPIGSASCPALAAAVSNAGGLGMLALTWKSIDSARLAIRKTKQLTNKPFGVNLVLAWDQRERLEVCLEEHVPVLSFSWGDPTPYTVIARNAGAKVMITVASAAAAKQAVELGADAVVAQGWEAGGHVLGEVATMVLVPCVVDAVSPVPVVATGGVADGRGVAAALALGAAGVSVGTAFLASEEANTHASYRNAVLNAGETSTVYTNLFNGGWDAPHRVIQNSTFERWLQAGSPPPGARPEEGKIIARHEDGSPVHLYDDVIPCTGMSGDLEDLALYAGQSVGLVHEVRPAGVIVRGLADGAVQVLRGLQTTLRTRKTKA